MPMAHHTATYSGLPSMAFEDSDTYPFNHGMSSTLPSTAYHGSEGYIDHDSVPAISIDNEGFEDIRLTAPKPTASLTRPNLGSRLLSTLSNAQAAAAPLARSGSVFHARAKSWAAFVPTVDTNSTSSTEKSRAQMPNRIFGNLFNGESATVRLGIPTSPIKEEGEEVDFVMEYRPSLTERPSRMSRRSTGQSVATVPPPKPSTAARTSWFSRKSSATTVSPSTTKAQDEFVHMDVNAALFPFGPADELSPHAYNDLLLNATSLLQKMQAAYREKVEYIASIQPEIDAQREEVEEAETRSKHLKIQLEDLSKQSAEQMKTNKELVEQLSEERMKVHNIQNQSSIRAVGRDPESANLNDEPRRRKRGSAASASDSGFESDADTSSVFSGGMETPVSQRSRLPLTPELETASWSLTSTRLAGRPGLHTMSSQSNTSSHSVTRRLGTEGAAWATVEKLRNENHDLRDQMEGMHRTLQGCIDFVGGVTGS